MSSTALLEHAPGLSSIDPSAFDHSSFSGLGNHGDSVMTLAQSDIEAEYVPAGIAFDDLADSNAQSMMRKIAWVIILAQLVTLIFGGLRGRGGGFAQAYGGAGGSITTRLICTCLAVFMLTDVRVVPPMVDMIQEGIVKMMNWIFQSAQEDAESGAYTY